MLTPIRSLLAASVLAGSVCVAAPALAQDSGFSVSANAAVVSDYRFRGVSLSDGDFAIQGGIDVSHSSGFYVGTWGSSLASFDNSIPLDDGMGDIAEYSVGDYGAAEIDVYGGWSGDVASGITIDVGFLYYLYPNATNIDAMYGPAGPSGLPTFDGYATFNTDYYEFYGSVGTTIGPVGATVGVAYAPDQDSLGDEDNLYLYSDFEAGIPETPLTLTAHLGYTDGVLAPEALATGLDDNGIDWSVGASLTVWDSLSLGISYIDTEGTSIKNFTDDAVVFTVGASF